MCDCLTLYHVVRSRDVFVGVGQEAEEDGQSRHPVPAQREGLLVGPCSQGEGARLQQCVRMVPKILEDEHVEGYLGGLKQGEGAGPHQRRAPLL